jgi:hypothetical protein
MESLVKAVMLFSVLELEICHRFPVLAKIFNTLAAVILIFYVFTPL